MAAVGFRAPLAQVATAAAVIAMSGCSADVSAVPTIAAASDLRHTLPAVVAAFRAAGGDSVNLTFGSSGNLSTQMAQGAPFELFLSADEGYVQSLHQSGVVSDTGVLYATGRIVLFVPNGSPLMDAVKPTAGGGEQQFGLEILTTGWTGSGKLALANWEHAPYGRAAREALERSGVWESVKERLVRGETISQATQFVTGGGADAGIISLSFVFTPEVKNAGVWAMIPDSLHLPLRQRMVLSDQAGNVAREFYEFVQSPAGRQILADHGFTVSERSGG